MDLVIRATVVFFFILLVTRIAGRRELSELEPFDLILLVVLGDLVQQGITQSDDSITGTLTVISTITLLSVAVSWASFRSRRVRQVTAGVPIVLLQDGRPIERNLRHERITVDELREEARRAQIASLDQLQWAILEDDGHISCIPRQG
ncbi:MAG: hypothetical protein JWL67_349 [Solirubrobacterales bacterium]|jgi:uncharacterized membrane protein YcaP (DUF421 family)|nr:hypothetical protein [Solirubrobacterales bacterium]